MQSTSKHTPEELNEMAEQANEKWRKRFEKEKYIERLGWSGIPKAYRGANLDSVSKGATKAYFDMAEGRIPGLILQGETGRGKTYAACAMLNSHLHNKLGRFSTMNGILARVRDAYRDNQSAEVIFSRYKNTKLLVLDDLGKENISQDSITKLFELIDHRVANELPTIITTQFTNADLLKRYTSRVQEKEVIEAILSRLSTYGTLIFNGEDRRIHG